MLKNSYNFSSIISYCYDNSLTLTSVLSVSCEYFLVVSILSISLFFILLPKIQFKYLNTKLNIFSFINYQLNFLAILILFFYCFLCMKQYFLFLSELPTFNNSILNDFTSLFAKLIIGLSSLIYLIFIQNYLIDQKLNYFEYYILILTAILGFCLLCCSNDLLTAYLAIELQGLSFYVLSSFKKTSNYSAESGVKYFIIGSFSTIIFLLGINLIYGVSGSISILDFKDLFVWVFSVNSFFLSFDYLPKALEFFQVEKLFNNQEYEISNDNFMSVNLRTIFNNFLILKNNLSISLSESFYFLNEVNQDPYCFKDQECLVESISNEMLNLVNQLDYSSVLKFNDKLEVFNLLFFEPRELIISSAFQNIVYWLLVDLQDDGLMFNDYDEFMSYFLFLDSESHLFNKFNYNWVSITRFESKLLEDFSEFSCSLTKDSMINDWSEYLSFRHLSESIDMALTTDIFDNYDPKKIGAPEVFNKTLENSINSNRLKIILEKFSNFSYITIEDSIFILDNIVKILDNIINISNLEFLFKNYINFSNNTELFFYEKILFFSSSTEEYKFYEQLSDLMTVSMCPDKFSPFLHDFGFSNDDCSIKDVIFDSRIYRIFDNYSISDQIFFNYYLDIFGSVNELFLSIDEEFIEYNYDPIKWMLLILNSFNDYYSYQILDSYLFFINLYFYESSLVENNSLLNGIEYKNMYSQQDFTIFLNDFLIRFGDFLNFKKSSSDNQLVFKELKSFKLYEFNEFFSLLLKYNNNTDNIFDSFDLYSLYYLSYLDAYKHNTQLLVYLLDVVTNLFKFIEYNDFFEKSSIITKTIVSDFEKNSESLISLEHIIKKFKLLEEKSTLSIPEARFLINQIEQFLVRPTYDSQKVELFNSLANSMKSNFLKDTQVFYDRVDRFKSTKLFLFLVSKIKSVFEQINNVVFITSLKDKEIDDFFENNYIFSALNIYSFFGFDFLSSSNIPNFIDYNINIDISQINYLDISSEIEFSCFLKSFLNKDLKIDYLKDLATIINYLLFYIEYSNNLYDDVILPKDLSYAQKIDFLNFIIFKIKSLKTDVRFTRWEFEFLLNELKDSRLLSFLKDSAIRKKYDELFSQFNSIFSTYLDNANRKITTNIFSNTKEYEHFYDARQTIWLYESTLNNLSIKELLKDSNNNCEMLSNILNSLFWKENFFSKYQNKDILFNILPDFKAFQGSNYFPDLFNNSLFMIDNNDSLNLIHILNLFPLFLDWSENKILNNNFMFDTLLIELGLLLILISLFLKLALTPFHLWSPDVYEGSPLSTTFFFVVVSKISIFVFLLKICYISFYSMIIHWQFYSLIVAILSILLGSIAALKQRKLKSLLAYSSISNMGLILAAFSTGNFEGIKAVFYYFIIYIISGLSIWSIFLLLKLKKKNLNEKYNKDLGDFSLLHESNNVLAYVFVVTIFTIAGIPPMVGFLAKISIFLSLIFSSMNVIAFLSIITSVIATFYYIRILKVIFFENMLVGKLFYPINSKITIILSLLFFFMLFLFINPLIINFFSYKVTLFLNKSFY